MLDVGQLQDHIQTLDKGDATARQQAIHALKQVEEQEWTAAPIKVMNALVKALQNQLLSGTKPPSNRQEIATVLGNMGSRAETAIPQLVELLQEGIPDGIREAAAAALGKMGKEAKPAVDALILLVSNRRATLANKAVRALSAIGCSDHRVQAALGNLWLSPAQPSNIQVQVAIALCKLKIDARGLVRSLTNTLMASQDASLRKSAAEALAWCSKTDVDVVPALLTAALHDKDEGVRQIAEAGLDQLRLSHAKAIHICATQLKDSSYAETALRNSGQAAVPALIEALATDAPASREKAARILGCFGEAAAQAVPALTATLRDKDLDVRLAAAKALWNISKNPDLVIPVMIELLEEKWPASNDGGEARRRFLQAVIESLGRIGLPAQAAIPALNQKTKDKNRHISEAAQYARKTVAPVGTNKAAATVRP
jgi:HEAT repeat protein